MQRRSDSLLERNLAGQKLICRLQIAHSRTKFALQYGRERREIDLTTLIGGQRDSKILPRQRSQRIAIEDGSFVGVLRVAKQRGDRRSRLDSDQILVRARRRQAGLRSRHVLILVEPEKDRHIEANSAEPVIEFIRLRPGGAESVLIVANAGGEIGQVFHLRKIERGVRAALSKRRLENLLPRRVGAI